ncbi:MAG: hypothetical protein CMA30_02250 [Euryarchaeota archaeon]|nr:hypothetical protein [Euryarchaeota archaeon]
MNEIYKLQEQFEKCLDRSLEDYTLEYINKDHDSYILTIRNNILYNRGLILDDFPFKDNHDPVFDIHVMDEPKFAHRIIKRKMKLQKIPGKIVLPFHKYQWNIYHSFLCDHNSYMNSQLANSIEYDSLHNFIDTPINRFLRNNFFPNIPVISDESFAFEELKIVSSGITTTTNNLNRLESHIEHLRRVFLSNTYTQSDKIFVYRTKGGRKIVNINDFNELDCTHLSDVDICSLDLYEQANMFNRAKIIFSIHDSSLYNIIFCQPGTNIVVAEPHFKNVEVEDSFEKVCKILNLNYIPVPATSIREYAGNWRDIDYNIDKDLVYEYFNKE